MIMFRMPFVATIRYQLGWRSMILILYVFFLTVYFVRNPQPDQFIGAFVSKPDNYSSSLLANLPALAFVVCGLALTMEQPSSMLLQPDSMAYVRQPHGSRQIASFTAIIIVYCLLFTGLTLLASYLFCKPKSLKDMLLGAAYAAMSLLLSLVLVNLGCLIGKRYLGYFAVILLQGTCMSSPSMQSFLMGASGFLLLPNWLTLAVLLTVIALAATIGIFNHLELI